MFDIRQIEPILSRALAAPLPGRTAQMRMVPRPEEGPARDRFGEGGRPAAALLLLYPRGGQAHCLLTVRHPDLPAHPGQVSLPGGIQETGEDLQETALRETEEEVGLARSGIRTVGSLSAVYIPVSGYRLHPFVGVCTEEDSRFRPHDAEVDRLLQVPLTDLGDPDRRHSEIRDIRGRRYRVPYFMLEGEKVWGATAMILAEFVGVLEVSGISPESPWPLPG